MASDAYYAAAVAWAEKNGVTGGIGGGLFGVLGMFIGVPAVALISNIVTDLVDKRNAAKSPADTADLHTADE